MTSRPGPPKAKTRATSAKGPEDFPFSETRTPERPWGENAMTSFPAVPPTASHFCAGSHGAV